MEEINTIDIDAYRFTDDTFFYIMKEIKNYLRTTKHISLDIQSLVINSSRHHSSARKTSNTSNTLFNSRDSSPRRPSTAVSDLPHTSRSKDKSPKLQQPKRHTWKDDTIRGMRIVESKIEAIMKVLMERIVQEQERLSRLDKALKDYSITMAGCENKGRIMEELKSLKITHKELQSE